MIERTLEDQLSRLPTEITPPAGVWERIHERLDRSSGRMHTAVIYETMSSLRRGLRLFWLLPAASILVVVSLTLGALWRTAQPSVQIAGLAIRAPRELQQLYADLDLHAHEYERAKEQLLTTVESLAELTGDVETLASVERQIRVINGEVSRLVALVRENPTDVNPAFVLTAFLTAEAASLMEISAYAAQFLN